MKIEVNFFSRLRDIVGGPKLDLDLPESQTLGELLARLYDDHPELRRWDKHLLIAVGLDYAGRDHILREGDAISVMPPVQGG